MKNIYNLPGETTIEKLEARGWKCIKYGAEVYAVGYYYEYNKPGYYCAIYDFLPSDEEDTAEAPLILYKVSEGRYWDEGHAFRWALTQ